MPYHANNYVHALCIIFRRLIFNDFLFQQHAISIFIIMKCCNLWPKLVKKLIFIHSIAKRINYLFISLVSYVVISEIVKQKVH